MFTPNRYWVYSKTQRTLSVYQYPMDTECTARPPKTAAKWRNTKHLLRLTYIWRHLNTSTQAFMSRPPDKHTGLPWGQTGPLMSRVQYKIVLVLTLELIFAAAVFAISTALAGDTWGLAEGIRAAFGTSSILILLGTTGDLARLCRKKHISGHKYNLWSEDNK